MKRFTREWAIKYGLDKVYDDYESVIKNYNSFDMQRAFQAGIEFADEYPKEDSITMSQFDETYRRTVRLFI